MATYQLVTNVAPSTTEGHAVTPVVPDFAKYKLLSSNEKETTIVSVASPLGLSNKFKYGVRDIQNIYSGTGIDPGLYPPVKSGVSVVFQSNETWTMKDPTDATLPVYALPVEAHMVIRIPNNELITTDNILGLISRALGSVLNSDLSNLAALIRGSHNPL